MPPADPMALLRQAAALLAQGRADQALPAARAALGVDPRHPDALNLAAACHYQLGQPGEALPLARRAAKRAPGHAGIRRNLGLIQAALGKLDEAVASLRRARHLDGADPRIRHDLATALNKLGTAHLEAGRPGPAARAYRDAMALMPETLGYRLNLARALVRHGAAEEAEGLLREAAEAGAAEAWAALGDLSFHLGDLAEARARFDQARAMGHAEPEFLSNLASTLDRLGEPWLAEGPMRAALRADPDRASFHYNLGNILSHAGRFAEAIEPYDRALAREPDGPAFRYNRAHALLAAGRLREGWADYRDRDMTIPLDGFERAALPADLSGAAVVLRGEQGLGDELFFLRYAPALTARGARATFAVSPKLHGVLAGQSLGAVAGYEAAAPDAPGLKLAVGDLPHLLGVDDVPAPLPLSVGAADMARARAALDRPGRTGRPAIGVTWRAGLKGEGPRKTLLYKEIAIERLAAILKPLAVDVAVLQRNPADGEVPALAEFLGRPVLDLSDANEDLALMAGVLALLDDYVAVSNTNVHIRESLGGRISRVLIATPFFSWGESGPASPWFPNAVAYRRDADGGWETALARLARDLARAHGAPGRG